MINRSKPGRLIDPRQRMIDETSAFLTWALRQDFPFPRIPRRRMDRGGFARLLDHPGARAAVNHWWSRALERVEQIATHRSSR